MDDEVATTHARASGHLHARHRLVDEARHGPARGAKEVHVIARASVALWLRAIAPDAVDSVDAVDEPRLDERRERPVERDVVDVLDLGLELGVRDRTRERVDPLEHRDARGRAPESRGAKWIGRHAKPSI